VEVYYYMYHRLGHGVDFLWFNFHHEHHKKDITLQPFRCEWTSITGFGENFIILPTYILYAVFVHPAILWIASPLDYVLAFYEHSSTHLDFRSQEMLILHTSAHHLIHHDATREMSCNFGLRTKAVDLLFGTHYDE
jgi:hypothetical protein